MEEVSFIMNYSEQDLKKLWSEQKMKNSILRRYVIFVVIMLIILAVLFPIYKNTCFTYAAFVIAFALVIAIQLPFVYARRKREETLQKLSHEHNLIHIINADGYITKSDESYHLIRWNRFDHIEEGREFIFLYFKGVGQITIFKYLLPSETIESIKLVLQSTPLQYQTK